MPVSGNVKRNFGKKHIDRPESKYVPDPEMEAIIKKGNKKTKPVKEELDETWKTKEGVEKKIVYKLNVVDKKTGKTKSVNIHFATKPSTTEVQKVIAREYPGHRWNGAANISVVKEETLDEVSIKKAINTYRKRENAHDPDYEFDDYKKNDRQKEKADADLGRIKKKWGPEIGKHAERSVSSKNYPGSETRPHHVSGYDPLATVMRFRQGQRGPMKSGPRKGKLDSKVQANRKISTKFMADYYHDAPKLKLPEETLDECGCKMKNAIKKKMEEKRNT